MSPPTSSRKASGTTFSRLLFLCLPSSRARFRQIAVPSLSLAPSGHRRCERCQAFHPQREKTRWRALPFIFCIGFLNKKEALSFPPLPPPGVLDCGGRVGEMKAPPSSSSALGGGHQGDSTLQKKPLRDFRGPRGSASPLHLPLKLSLKVDAIGWGMVCRGPG